MAYGKYKDLNKRTESEIKLLKFLVIQNIMDLKEGLALIIYKIFDKR